MKTLLCLSKEIAPTWKTLLEISHMIFVIWSTGLCMIAISLPFLFINDKYFKFPLTSTSQNSFQIQLECSIFFSKPFLLCFRTKQCWPLHNQNIIGCLSQGKQSKAKMVVKLGATMWPLTIVIPGSITVLS